MKPNITIIVTCFNGEKYLNECFDSILKQSYTKWQVLFVDDASSDQSLAIAKKYVALNQKIKIIENQVNLGHYASLNKALRMTQTEFFSRVDADDTIDAGYLARCMEIIAETSNLGAVFVNFNYFDENGNTSNDFPELVSNNSFEIGQLLPEGNLKISQYYFDPSLPDYFRGIGLIRTALAKELGGFEEWVSESDILLYIKLACKSQVYCLNDRLYNYRKHQKSATTKISASGQDLNWKKMLLLKANDTLFGNKILSARAHKKQKKSIINEYQRHMINRSRKKLNIPRVFIHFIKLTLNQFR